MEEQRSRQLTFIILLSVVGLLLIINLLKFGTIASIFLIYCMVLSKFSGLGIHDQLIKVISIPLAFILWFIITKLAISWNKKKRLIGYIALVTLLTAHAATLFAVTKDDYFKRISGESAKYYTINPITGDIQLFDQPIYDEFGRKAEPVTSEIVKEIEARKMYENAETSLDEITTFFDRITGKPLIYYSIDQNGIYRFYVNDGFSPIDGQPLKPVTREVLNGLKKSKEETLKREKKIREQSTLINQLQKELKTASDEKDKQEQTVSALSQQLENLQSDMTGIKISASQLKESDKRIEILRKEVENLRQAEQYEIQRKPIATPTPKPKAQYLGVLVNENEKDEYSFVFSSDIQTIAREVKPKTIMSIYLPKGNYDWRILKDSKIQRKGQIYIHTGLKLIVFDEKAYFQRNFTKIKASKEKDATPIGQYYFCLKTR